MRRQIRRFVFPLLAAAGAGCGPMAAQAGAPLAVSCAAEDSGLCAGFMDLLREAAPQREIARQDPPPTEGPALRLLIDGQGPYHIAAHLEWRLTPGGAEWQVGPDLRMDVSDHELTPEMRHNFLRKLLSFSKVPF